MQVNQPDPGKKQTSHVFITEGSLATWNKVPTKSEVPAFPKRETRVLSSLMFTFSFACRDGSRRRGGRRCGLTPNMYFSQF